MKKIIKKIRRKIQGYVAIFEKAPEGGYDVYFPDLPGCVTFGNDFKQTVQASKEALSLWLEHKRENPLVPYVIIPNYGDDQIIHAKTLKNIIKYSGIPKEKFFKN